MAAEYVFPQGYLETNRINLQHYLWVRLFGYLIHPDIPTHNPQLRIADIGCGTGIWLTDLSDQLPPSVQLDGIDVSFSGCPPAQWLPPNVALRHWDVKTEPPEDLIGVYDIIQVRFFAYVLLEKDIKPVIARFMKLLKPGGHLQWADLDTATWCYEKTDAANSTDALDAFKDRQIVFTGPQLSPLWVATLPDLFRDSGLEDVKADVRDAPPHVFWPMHYGYFLTVQVLAQNKELISEEDIYTREKLSARLEQAEKETAQGSAWAFTRIVVTGRKPIVY